MVSLFSIVFPMVLPTLPSGKHTKNDGKSPFSMGKSTISMAIFNSYGTSRPLGRGAYLGRLFEDYQLCGCCGIHCVDPDGGAGAVGVAQKTRLKPGDVGRKGTVQGEKSPEWGGKNMWKPIQNCFILMDYHLVMTKSSPSKNHHAIFSSVFTIYFD